MWIDVNVRLTVRERCYEHRRKRYRVDATFVIIATNCHEPHRVRYSIFVSFSLVSELGVTDVCTKIDALRFITIQMFYIFQLTRKFFPSTTLLPGMQTEK